MTDEQILITVLLGGLVVAWIGLRGWERRRRAREIEARQRARQRALSRPRIDGAEFVHADEDAEDVDLNKVFEQNRLRSVLFMAAFIALLVAAVLFGGE